MLLNMLGALLAFLGKLEHSKCYFGAGAAANSSSAASLRALAPTSGTCIALFCHHRAPRAAAIGIHRCAKSLLRPSRRQLLMVGCCTVEARQSRLPEGGWHISWTSDAEPRRNSAKPSAAGLSAEVCPCLKLPLSLRRAAIAAVGRAQALSLRCPFFHGVFVRGR